jgi:hypothetical protein
MSADLWITAAVGIVAACVVVVLALGGGVLIDQRLLVDDIRALLLERPARRHRDGA